MRGFLACLLTFWSVQTYCVDQTAVTRAEAATVFARAEQALSTVLRLKKKPVAFAGGSGTATREEILQHLFAVYEASEPKFKFTPPLQKPAREALSFRAAKTKAIAQKLEAMGFIDRYGPLATSKSVGLMPAEFGDALGFFIARLAELTHT